MPFTIPNTTSADVPNRRRRSPASVLVTVAAVGILVDRMGAVPIDTWLSVATFSATGWLFCFQDLNRRKSKHDAPTSRLKFDFVGWGSVLCLLIGWFCLAGAWHHWRWSCRAFDDIANSATDQPQIVRLIGKVSQTPWIVRHAERDHAPWQQPIHTVFVISCRSLRMDDARSMSVSGAARVSVSGSLPRLANGDVVEVTGELVLPSEPQNPGSLDQRAFLKAQNISALVRCDHIEGIEIVSNDRTIGDCLSIARGAIRKRAEQLLENQLSSDTAPVAQAMLLGTRVQIDEETRRAFRESGMLHILAISGMNVGLLWSWLWSISRWLGRSAKTSIWIVLVGLPLYAIITDANPPIVRATVVAVIVAFGQMIGRAGSIANLLALAGLAILAWNPADLFNTGAQLSFLAVFAILHVMNWLSLLYQETNKKIVDAPLEDSYLWHLMSRFVRSAFEAIVVGLAVWTITSPLVASEFHLISPIGSLLTVLLIIPVTFMFWVGYSFLLLGLVWSAGFGWIGSLFDFCLSRFLWTVRTGAGLELGHTYIPAPPLWWTMGFYALTLIPILAIHRRNLGAKISVRAGMSWLVFGLAWGLLFPPNSGVTCTFISVGHGLGVLIECPSGTTALYDAGSMADGAAIARTISQTLWASGRSRLDCVVISHADGDHCNALPELGRIVSPGKLIVHKSFLDWNQPPVTAAIEETARSGAKLQLISEGQSIVLDPDVSLRVLHPPHDFHSSKDNPNSLVLCLEYAGRKILLTGDLELEGLERLLQTPGIDVDVLLSPHHGSLKANPRDLARWARPEYVVVSTSDPVTSERLTTQYGSETEILTTALSGAIRCRIDPDGALHVEPFRISEAPRTKFRRLASQNP